MNLTGGAFIVALFTVIGNKFKIFNIDQNIMNKDINSLKIRLQELDREILMVEKQLPAHSVKPPIMTQLFELEDERDTIFKELERLKRPDTD